MAKSNKNVSKNYTTKESIVEAIASGELDTEAGLAALKAIESQPKPISFKASEKGALSVYGLQRMPVTLYVGQWKRLADAMKDLLAFAEDNKDRLSQGRDDKKNGESDKE